MDVAEHRAAVSLTAPQARALAALLLLFMTACTGRVVDRQRTTRGPFEIEQRTVRISSGGFPNTSGNPFATMPVTYFALFHDGALVTVATDDGPRDEFWEARFLDGAPRPAVLLVDTGVYLVTERDGTLDVRVLIAPGDEMATHQWLDARDGQPGDEITVGIADGSSVPRALGSGSLLLVSGECVLDVSTLASRCVRLNTWELLQTIDQYYAAGAPPTAVSPRRTQVAYPASRQAGMDYEYAVVVADYARGGAYAVPFDRDFARFESVWDATPDWLAHYFIWTVEPDGSERLRPRAGVTPRPWVGRMQSSGADYVLTPARRELMPVLVAFVERELGATFVADASNPDLMRAAVDGGELSVWFRPEERSLSLFASNSGSQPLSPTVGRLGELFNQQLLHGEHQALFGSFKVP